MKGLSIITPHYNCFVGLQTIYDCLQRQTSNAWEWIIVDDCSNPDVVEQVDAFFSQMKDPLIKVFFNDKKSNASVCRNLGLNEAKYENVIFLDSDDIISEKFVLNRIVPVETFLIYRNYIIVDENNNQQYSSKNENDYLNRYLGANFPLQTTTFLWNVSYLKTLNGFDPNMNRLQDVELSIRALMDNKNLIVVDNEIDFYYKVKPIRNKINFVPLVCESVNYLIKKLKNHNLSNYQKSRVKGYYFLCVKYLHRSQNREYIQIVLESLNLFYRNSFVTKIERFLGAFFLFIYGKGLIGLDFFLKVNRYLFKPL